MRTGLWSWEQTLKETDFPLEMSQKENTTYLYVLEVFKLELCLRLQLFFMSKSQEKERTNQWSSFALKEFPLFFLFFVIHEQIKHFD